MKTTGVHADYQVVHISQRHRLQHFSVPALRKVINRLLANHLQLNTYELGIHMVGEREIIRINEHFLQHTGSTDVITFDYRNDTPNRDLAGEIFICPQVGKQQAADYNTTWPDEVLRYIVHGILHLLGYDDIEPEDRRIMKAAENRWMKKVCAEVNPASLLRGGPSSHRK